MTSKTENAFLYITLTDTHDLSEINKSLAILRTIPALSANESWQQLKQGTTDNLFLAMEIFLELVEGKQYRTYPDSKGNMTIGIGLNLKNSDTEALIIALSNHIGRHLDYNELKTTLNRPVDALNDADVYYLLWLTLVGVVVTKPDGTQIEYVGQAEQLFKQLDAHGLGQTLFTPCQITALQSLCYNSNALIGYGLCDALKEFPKQQEKDLVNALIEIVECSNSDRIVGLANRRLKEAGLFVGDPTLVRIPYRQVQKISVKNPDITIVDGPAVYPLPYGDYHLTYIGGDTRVVEPGRKKADGSDSHDDIYYGSNKGDSMEYTNIGDPVLLGGDGDDVLTILKANNPYLSGNNGIDRYVISSGVNHALIYDNNRKGSLEIDSIKIEGVAKCYADNVYSLQISGKTYKLTLAVINNIAMLNVNWGIADSDVTIANFKSGEFGIVLADTPKKILQYPADGDCRAFIQPNGNIFILTLKIDPSANGTTSAQGDFTTLRGRVFTSDGKLMTDVIMGKVVMTSVAQANCTQLVNGNIVLCWFLRGNPCQLLGKVFSAAGALINDFEVMLPKDTPSVSDFKVSAIGNGFIVTFVTNADGYPLCAQLFNDSGTSIGSSYIMDILKSKPDSVLHAISYAGKAVIAIGLSTEVAVYTCDAGGSSGKQVLDFAGIQYLDVAASGNFLIVGCYDDNSNLTVNFWSGNKWQILSLGKQSALCVFNEARLAKLNDNYMLLAWQGYMSSKAVILENNDKGLRKVGDTINLDGMSDVLVGVVITADKTAIVTHSGLGMPMRTLTTYDFK